jgi:hypothetical protein
VAVAGEDVIVSLCKVLALVRRAEKGRGTWADCQTRRLPRAQGEAQEA